MKKRLLVAATAMLVTFSSQAQSMQSLWASMPDSLLPYLNHKTRTLMVDAVGDTVSSSNNLSSVSSIVAITADYLKATLTEASSIEMKRFANLNGDSVIAVVSTYYGPEPESQLNIYDTTWRLLAANLQLDATLSRPDTMTEDEFELLKDKVEPLICAYHLSPNNLFLSATYALPIHHLEDKQKLKAILREKKYNLPTLLQNEVK